MSDDELNLSVDRAQITFRFDKVGWSAFCRYSQVFFEGAKTPAIEAAVLDALLEPVPFPDAPSLEFTEHVADYCEALAERLTNIKKQFHYGDDVAKALIAAVNAYPELPSHTVDTLPFARLMQVEPEPDLPTVPAYFKLAVQFQALLPDKVRPFITESLVRKVESLRISDPMPVHLLPPRSLPTMQVVKLGRHLDEALVALLAALPFTVEHPRLPVCLRWLRAAVTCRQI